MRSKAKTRIFWRLAGRANKRMKVQQSGSTRSLYKVFYPFRNQRIWTIYSRMPFPIFLSLLRWVLTPDQIIISATRKMNIFKMLDFQKKNSCSRKRPWKHATHFLNRTVEINLSELDHPISNWYLIRRFLTMITNFWGSLKAK